MCVVVVWSYSVGYSSSKFYLCYGKRSQLIRGGVLLDPGWAWGGGGTCHLKEEFALDGWGEGEGERGRGGEVEICSLVVKPLDFLITQTLFCICGC